MAAVNSRAFGRHLLQRRDTFRRRHHAHRGDVDGAAGHAAARWCAPSTRRWPASGRAPSPACALRSSGSDARYGVADGSPRRGPPRRSRRCASGISACAWSTMPRPARSTGTSSGGLASRDPVVSASGVRTGTGLGRRVAGRLVDQHQRQVAQRGTERRRCRCARHAAWSAGRRPAGGQRRGHPRGVTLYNNRTSAR